MCDHEMARCVDSTEPKEEGRFVEQYECTNCGATGMITGKEEEPAHRWDRHGEVFA